MALIAFKQVLPLTTGCCLRRRYNWAKQSPIYERNLRERYDIVLEQWLNQVRDEESMIEAHVSVRQPSFKPVNSFV